MPRRCPRLAAPAPASTLSKVRPNSDDRPNASTELAHCAVAWPQTSGTVAQATRCKPRNASEIEEYMCVDHTATNAHSASSRSGSQPAWPGGELISRPAAGGQSCAEEATHAIIGHLVSPRVCPGQACETPMPEEAIVIAVERRCVGPCLRLPTLFL